MRISMVASPRTVRLTVLVSVFLLSILAHSQSRLLVGYSLLTSAASVAATVGSALFSYTNSDGTLVCQAGVGAAEPIFSGRILVDEEGTRTGIALVNPSRVKASLTLVVRDAAGTEIARRSDSLEAGNQLAQQYIYQLFPDLPSGLTGSLTFESSQRLAAVTLREGRNARAELLYSTLPVVDLASKPTAETVIFPQIAAGAGYITQLILINPSGSAMNGRIRFTDSGGNPLSLHLRDSSAAQFSYQIAAHGVFRAAFDHPSGLTSGYASVTPDLGSTTPSGAAIFQFIEKGFVVTEAGVAAAYATGSARMYVDNVNSYSGIALANLGDQSAPVAFTLLDRYGLPEDTTTRILPPRGHLAVFVHELFPSVAGPYTGLLDISSVVDVAPVSLKLTFNGRGDQVLTTLPVADLRRPPAGPVLVFPQIALGEGFSTRIILLNTEKTRPAGGRLDFFQSNGSAMTIPMGGRNASQFVYELLSGGGRQFLPGAPGAVASIAVLDPISNSIASEVAVNQGKSVRPRLLVLDTGGTYRDDFDLSFASLSTDVAEVDSSGNIQGRKAGFSTLTVSADGVLSTATISVVAVESGPTGFDIRGVAQDLSRRLYLANSIDHTILRAEDLKKTPTVFAGVDKTSGLKDDLRLNSWFRNPAFLAYNNSEGSLYVSDASNNAIRRVPALPAGKVETLAGNGVRGNRDGTVSEALFDNPQGIALDNRGYLWVVDSGNHTIRRINLAKGIVTTVAGKAGSPGWVDGKVDQARFRAPSGIAFESESVAAQLERERKGEAPPPVRMIVADTGNGGLRRVSESGDVETLRSTQTGAPSTRGARPTPLVPAASPLSFGAPTGVAVDPFGNIYVTEPETGRVRVILESGEVVSATQAKSFINPKGISITQSGRVVAADGSRTAQEIVYGEPQIKSVSPNRIDAGGGGKITVKGKNYVPGTRVIIGNVLIRDAKITDSETISFIAPVLLSGLSTLTVQNRGGIAQISVMLEPLPLSQTPAGYITTIAGGSTFSGEGKQATSAAIGEPRSVAVDSSGNLFIADPDNHRIRRVAASTGILTTVAGNGEAGYSGDNGLATVASLNSPRGIVVDSSGDVFLSDTANHLIRKINLSTGVITTIAGNGKSSFSGDGGPARAAGIWGPHGLVFDTEGNLFVAESLSHRIRKISAKTGIISTVVGVGELGSSGDNGPATAARIAGPRSVALDSDGNLFLTDSESNRIRRVDARTGVITTVAGTGLGAYSGDGGLATRAALNLPTGFAFDAAGNLFIGDTQNHRVRKVAAGTGIITTVAGNGETGFPGDNRPAVEASLDHPREIAVDASGNLFIADSIHRRIRKVALETGVISTVAGNGESGFSGDGAPATAASMDPREIVLDAQGNLLIAETHHNRVRKVDAQTNIITTLAGNGEAAYAGDEGPATSASLNGPEGVALDIQRNVLISDTGNNRIRKINRATGLITTLAGSARAGFSGDQGAAVLASLNSPRGIAVDAAGNLFIADAFNHRIRKVEYPTGTISTVAGNGLPGFSGDGGGATLASLNSPRSVYIDSAGHLLIADALNHRIRRVDADTGIIRTIAGIGSAGFSGDNGPALAARLNEPRDVTSDAAGNLLFADTFNLRVRRVDARTGIISTVAGGGNYTVTQDNLPATQSAFRIVRAVAVDGAGNLLVADTGLARIRAVRAPPP